MDKLIIVEIIVIVILAGLVFDKFSLSSYRGGYKVISTSTIQVQQKPLVNSSGNQTAKATTTKPATKAISPAGSSLSSSFAGATGAMTYKVKAAAGNASDPSVSVSLPVGSYGFCAAAHKGSSTIAMIGGPASINNCGSYGSSGTLAEALLEVYGSKNYTEEGITGFSRSTTNNFNISISPGYSSEFVAVGASCINTNCSLSLPSGCKIVSNVTYNSTTAIMAICTGLSPGKYNARLDLSNPSGSESDAASATFYN
ncbi:MAG: hypothetical protein ACP5RP_02060 [Candidatus Micrarchaeia archaeon]